MSAAPDPFQRNRAELLKSAVKIDLYDEPKLLPVGQAVPEDRGAHDITNARRFADHHRDRLRYAVGVGWLLYDGKRWERQPGKDIPKIEKLAKQTANIILAEASDPKERNALRRLTCQRPRIEAMIHFARSELLVNVEDLDRNPYMLNCLNCTVDARNGKTHPHDRADLITKVMPVNYNPRATAPRFRKFLAEVFPGDADTREHVQRAIGYSFTADVREEVFWIFAGDGNNGKGVLMQTLMRVAGKNEYAITARQEMIVESRNSKREDVASLFGIHHVQINETEEGAHLDEAFIKNATGGDPIRAGFLYKEQFEFWPTQHYFVSTNHRLRIRGQDKGTWRRPLLVEFNVTFGEKGGPKIDKGLKNYLRRHELPGVLRWVVEGAVKWFNKGKPDLRVSKAVRVATTKYQKDESIMRQFIEDHCTLGKNLFMTVKAFSNAFNDWLEHQMRKRPWEGTTIGKRLKQLGYQEEKLRARAVTVVTTVSD